MRKYYVINELGAVTYTNDDATAFRLNEDHVVIDVSSGSLLGDPTKIPEAEAPKTRGLTLDEYEEFKRPYNDL